MCAANMLKPWPNTIAADHNHDNDSTDSPRRPCTEGDGGREKLLRRAGESLREIRSRMPSEELTPEIEQEVVEAVQAYRAERRARRVG